MELDKLGADISPRTDPLAKARALALSMAALDDLQNNLPAPKDRETGVVTQMHTSTCGVFRRQPSFHRHAGRPTACPAAAEAAPVNAGV
ncbi:hypothetical protein [Rhizobium sp. BK176]|uniref:hypothetical protein n=1 Tax=Rhizobium sp. BK176 TaxID=2587071 RepID=UPI002169A67C|nr:hypothetical protein [Rhizobium sp. BK176]MCS4089413.1 hypothetical protein [Rhizobium sp. BK176]